MVWLEKVTRNLMLFVGLLGIIVIYLGFFYLLFSGRDTSILPWYLLLSPWICVFYGLSRKRQLEVFEWLKKKIVRK
ncbi:hypothetical protein FS418_08530 [Shewanella sp. YLB-09]|nr:hypothetical protein FS418_08530 [Shewanella sp. YLB-09]